MLCRLNSISLNKRLDYHISIMTKYTLEKRNHRAVAPVIATLLMVAIAVVGGTIIFVFAQGFFSQSQISGTPTIEAVKILGYDARDVDFLKAHDNTDMAAGTGSDPTAIGKNADERVAVYVKNDSVNQVLFTEIRLGGTVYSYDTSAALTAWDSATDLIAGEYSVLTDSSSILSDQAAVLNPGQSATILMDLEDDFPIGRDTQFKLTTTNGAIFVGTVVMGQNSG
jgi:archaeal type IV pilus assembly protein PilA